MNEKKFDIGDEVRFRFEKHWCFFAYGIVYGFTESGSAKVIIPGRPVHEIIETSLLVHTSQR